MGMLFSIAQCTRHSLLCCRYLCPSLLLLAQWQSQSVYPFLPFNRLQQCLLFWVTIISPFTSLSLATKMLFLAKKMPWRVGGICCYDIHAQGYGVTVFCMWPQNTYISSIQQMIYLSGNCSIEPCDALLACALACITTTLRQQLVLTVDRITFVLQLF